MMLNEKIIRQIKTIKAKGDGMNPSERYKSAMSEATAKAAEADKRASEASREEVAALFDIARARAAELVRWHVSGRK